VRGVVVGELALPEGALSTIRLAGGGGWLAAITNGLAEEGGRAGFCCWRVDEQAGVGEAVELAGLGPRERGRPHSVAISPDGARLALGSKSGGILEKGLHDSLVARRLGTPRRLGGSEFTVTSPLAHDNRVEALCYSQDGRRLYSVSASSSGGPCDLAIWDVESGAEVRRAHRLQRSYVGVDVGPRGEVLIWDEKGQAWCAPLGER